MTPQTFTFRPLRRGDFGQLGAWLDAPHVKMWWREASGADDVERRYGPVVDGFDRSEVFIIEAEGQDIGMIQRYRFEDDSAWQRAISVAGTPGKAAGIDYFIGVETLTGIGLGPQLIGAFVADTWDRYPDIAALVVDVQQDNRRSWRALETVGFTRVWTGPLDSDDPSDEGVNYVYLLRRPAP